jgi:hypothetical protein
MRRAILLGLGLILSTTSLGAQGLPLWRPINPTMTSRSALGFDPVVTTGRGWRFGMQIDHANMLEAQDRTGGDLVLDAEVTRLDLRIGHDLGTRWYVQGVLPLEAAEDGFLDPFVDWWHGVFGFREARREQRPRNTFEYDFTLPDGSSVTYDRSGIRLGDLRATVGYRLAPGWQAALTMALPTGQAPGGYSMETVGFGLTTTYRGRLGFDRLTYEGGIGVGYTPPAGDLKDWQRTVFASAASGLRFRAVGQQSVYANVLFHSATYRGTTLPSLDDPDLSLDFGFLLKPGNGPEILLGMVEDLYPFGPAVDMVFRLGVRW